ncbi:MAG: hypothetical protein ABWX96_06005, partial [Propionibacteriaceae bacterium]
RADKVVTIKADSATLAWAYASFAVANSKAYGLVSADVGGQRWQTETFNLPSWTAPSPEAAETTVTLTVR